MAAFAVACLAFGLMDDPRFEKWAVVHCLGAIGLLCLWRWEWKTPHVVAAVFVSWMILSLAWSPDWRAGIPEIRDAAALLSAGWLLSRMGERNIARASALTVVGLIVLCQIVPFGGQGNPNFVAELLALLLPWCFTAGWSIVGLIGMGYFLALEPNLVWLVSGVTVLAVAFRISPWFGGGLLLTGAAGGWWAAVSVVDIGASVNSRAELWVNTGFMWLEKPFFGWGAGSFDWAYSLFRERHIEIWPDMGTMMHPLTAYAGHAHNEILEVLAHYGVVGALIALAGLLALRNGDIRAVWTLLIAATLSLTGFPLHNPASALVIMVSLAHLASAPVSSPLLWSPLLDFMTRGRTRRYPLHGASWGPTPSGRSASTYGR